MIAAVTRSGAAARPRVLEIEGPSSSARAASRLGLYLHVPFCAVRCRYCDFSSGSLSAAAVERYLRGIEREAALRAPAARGRRFTSVFFGGGTPSALAARHFARLWKTVRDHFEVSRDAEITLEANPESVRPALLEAWTRAGVNRLSMGAQSFLADELETLGRIHDAERPGEAFRLARAHGVRRLSLDLMFGFPGHTGERFARTLDRALSLTPEHLSAYCFIPEPGTSLGDRSLARPGLLPSPEEQADLYAMLEERVEAAGYANYETSNFCRPGGEVRHNLVYWLRRDYLALGPSAHGLWKGVRYGNHYGTERWASALEAGEPCGVAEDETARARADEIVMLGLRLADGIREADYPRRQWSGMLGRFERSFAAAIAQGRLEPAGTGVRIPRAHRFVADDVIAWLMADADRRARNAALDLTPARIGP